jgi:hypothetical protein
MAVLCDLLSIDELRQLQPNQLMVLQGCAWNALFKADRKLNKKRTAGGPDISSTKVQDLLKADVRAAYAKIKG